MKRSELSVGLEVEVEKYGSYETVVVVATEPWYNSAVASWRRAFKPASEWTGNRSGVAVARQEREFGANGELVWRPDVVQLQRLRPKGTGQEVQKAQDQERAQRETYQANQRRRLDAVTASLGLESYQTRFAPGYRSTGSDFTTVQLSLERLEKLAQELTRLREEVNR